MGARGVAHQWTDAEDEIIRNGYAEGTPVRVLATQLGISTWSISKRAGKIGADHAARSRVQAAVEANRIDGKARRQKLIERIYTRSEAIMERLEAPEFVTLVPTAPGVQSRTVLDFVPPADERALANSLSSYLGTVERLEKIDADNGAADARSMLERLATALGVTGPAQ